MSNKITLTLAALLLGATLLQAQGRYAYERDQRWPADKPSPT